MGEMKNELGGRCDVLCERKIEFGGPGEFCFLCLWERGRRLHVFCVRRCRTYIEVAFNRSIRRHRRRGKTPYRGLDVINLGTKESKCVGRQE
jgi:hypothetical protein